MNLLHICSYYIGNKLYSNLLKELSKKNINQDILIPVRKPEHIGLNEINTDKYSGLDFNYAYILNSFDRVLYHAKIQKQVKWVEKNLMLRKKIDVIHAHTIFSDGGTAFELFKKFNINYIVNVRNTDINFFYKYGIHLRKYMYDILKNSKKIVFISYAYQEELTKLLPKNILNNVIDKFEVVPNGIDAYWHGVTINNYNNSNFKEVKLLFIGKLDKNKNVESVIKACSNLHGNGYKCSLQIIGSGPQEKKLKKLCGKLDLDRIVKFHGYISEKNEIKAIMEQSNIFVMPSLKETFGLVYIEAMSRGLPIIYSKDQGVDGFFKEGDVGFSVNPKNYEEISSRIIKITNKYSDVSKNCKLEAQKFNWETISDRYLDIYKD